MVKATVMLVTKRRDPKFEYALQSLKEQTFHDFELIIVDGYYHDRKDEVQNMIKDMELPFHILHIPDKPSRWKGQRLAIANARNTALIYANGEYIIQIDDCAKMPRDWIQMHVNWLVNGYFCASNWISYEGIDKNGKGIIVNSGLEYRSARIMKPCIFTAGWFYGQNSSYPLDGALSINGFDEILDGEIGQEDISFGIRLERSGYKMIFDPINNTEVYLITHKYNRLIPPVNMTLKDGILHFSNEWIMQNLLDDTERVMPYGNHFNLRELRGLVKGKSIDDAYNILEKYIDPDLEDWRDGKLISEKLDMEIMR